MYQHSDRRRASVFTKLARFLADKPSGRRHRKPMRIGTLAFESLESRKLLTTTVSPVLDVEGTAIEGATSSLTRTADAISLTVTTHGLQPGVYTVTVIAFNNPENCKEHCGADDIDREEVNASMIFGTGKEVGDPGATTFVVNLDEGDPSNAVSGAGIADTFDAEISFTIVSKGPASPDPAQLDIQLTTIDMGCPQSGCIDLQNGHHMSPLTLVTVGQMLDSTHDSIPIENTFSRLTRYEDRIRMRIDTTELPPGVHTAWLVTFNNWEQCEGGCGGDDLDREGVNASRMWADFAVVDEGGDATFNFERTIDDKTRIERGPGLLAPFTAEIHGGTRFHGEAIPELLDEQTTTFNGGCPPNTCQNLQVSPNNSPEGPLPVFVATSLDATSTGFVAEFSAALDPSSLNIFDTEQLGPADIAVEGADVGPVTGSLVVDPSLRKVTFVKSGGALAPDTYTVTLRTGTDGFKSEGGRPLEGNGGAIGINSLGTTFTVGEPTADTISVGMPDFVRGPGQDVNLPADSADIPLSISEGTNVRSINLQVSYDPALLDIAGAAVGGSMPAGASVNVNTTTPGLLTLAFLSPTALPAGSSNFVNLQASVPASDANGIYGKQQVLDVHAVTVSDGNVNEFPVISDDAVHLVSYLADVSGNAQINASDAAQVARVAALLDDGFEATILTDPRLVGDISGNGRINAADASLVAQFAALFDVPEIPAIPSAIATAGSLDAEQFDSTLLLDRPQDPAAAAADHSTEPSTSVAGRFPNHIAAVDSVIGDRWELSVGEAEERASLALKEAVDEIFAGFEESGLVST